MMAVGERCRYIEEISNNKVREMGTFQFNGWFAAVGYKLYAEDLLEGMSVWQAGLKLFPERY